MRAKLNLCRILAPLRGRIVVATTALATGLFLFIATPALAARQDTGNSISGFEGLTSAGFDAEGNVWLTDGSKGEPHNGDIYKYSPYPSQTLLALPVTSLIGGIRENQIAVDQSTGEVFVTIGNGSFVAIFDHHGNFLRDWSGIDGVEGSGRGIVAAVDNSNTYSAGRIYLSLGSPEADIQMYDPQQRPVDFPASASYIDENKLTGTPAGPFAGVAGVDTGPNGEIFVAEPGNGVDDEFDSSGTFIRTLPYGGVVVDPSNDNILIGPNEYDSSGNLLEALPANPLAVNAFGYLYAGGGGGLEIYGPAAAVPTVAYSPVTAPTVSSGTLNATVDPGAAGTITSCSFEYGEEAGSYTLGNLPCESAENLPYSSTTGVHADLSALTTGTEYHYRVVLNSPNGVKYGTDQVYAPQPVFGLETDAVANLTESSATLRASFVGNGEDVHYYFEWGTTATYGHTTAAPPFLDAGSPVAPTRAPLSFDLEGLVPYTTYHYRVVAKDGGGLSYGTDRYFTTTPGAPTVASESATAVHSDRALLHAQVDPNGADTAYFFEYVTNAEFEQNGWVGASEAGLPNEGAGRSKHFQSLSALAGGLEPGTLYHYRVVATNAIGTGLPSADHTFTTFPFSREIDDPCPNAHIRQQTGAALLLDCRGYELVSAANANGYDVESDLVAGQTPFTAHPAAQNPAKVLYGIHDGALPGSGFPTNNGIDPYVATRGEDGWSTRYVGIPGNDPSASGAFSSSLLEADAELGAFAFGGEGICAPCFEDGSRGEPIHLPGGELIQGMAGSIAQPSAEPAGFIGRHLSADGSHFVFGSTAQFEPDGNEGEISIYDRNLETDVTRVVSKTPTGQTMQEEGKEIGELDISKNGSRIVIGHLVEEVDGVKYWHLYMNIGDSGETVDLTPGTTHGVLFDGMTESGSSVYFTTKDRLLTATNQDTDESADIYRADVSGSSVTLTRVSIGTEGSGNADSCDPAGDSANVHWNTTTGEPNCGAVAVDGGIASGDGTIYFLSPEQLDGSGGVPNAPNLYLARPGSAPHFVSTLESDLTGPNPPLTRHKAFQSYASAPTAPTIVATDNSGGPSAGDLYVVDANSDTVSKYDQAGHLIVGWGAGGHINGSGSEEFGEIVGIAVDSTGALYVLGHENHQLFKFSQDGTLITEVHAAFGSLVAGIAVDSEGDIYKIRASGQLAKLAPSGEPILEEIDPGRDTSVAVDPGNESVYVIREGSEIFHYEATGRALGRVAPTLDLENATGLAVDPTNHDLYVDAGDRVIQLDPSGAVVHSAIDSSPLAGSGGVAADSAGDLFASDRGAEDVALSPLELKPNPESDNPIVLDSVNSPEVPSTSAFELTPSGEYAAFTSTLPLTGYDNASHREVFRYDASGNALTCASCNPTSEQATGDATLPSYGPGLSDDGRVFFNSAEGLVDRDNNGSEDAYEWEPQGSGPSPAVCQPKAGCVDLVSSGLSPFPSGLLGVSEDGVDAYFFTRDKLAEGDQNGSNVRIYDARSFGGFPFTPSAVQCKASDECHGPGSPLPPPPEIKTFGPTPLPASSPAKCKPAFVRKHGRCQRKSRRRAHKTHRHVAHIHRGGPK